MSKAYERIETPKYDGLVVDINPPADVMAVKIRKETSKAETRDGTGVINRNCRRRRTCYSGNNSKRKRNTDSKLHSCGRC